MLVGGLHTGATADDRFTQSNPCRHLTQVIGVQECLILEQLKEAIRDYLGRELYVWCVRLLSLGLCRRFVDPDAHDEHDSNTYPNHTPTTAGTTASGAT